MLFSEWCVELGVLFKNLEAIFIILGNIFLPDQVVVKFLIILSVFV